MSEPWTSWIGRSESSTDIVTAAPVAALSATLDRDDPFPQPGDPLPLLWHWLFFLPRHRASELAVDGHARLGEFLPPVPLPRRMYAGGRVSIRHPLCVGDPIQRITRIVEIDEKSGRSGPLVFVKVRHEISSPTGLALIEDHDIVYRELAAGRERKTGSASTSPDADQRAAGRVDRAVETGGDTGPTWEREVVFDEVLLFRYSALTFNAYRIHYDRRFTTETQGYPGLVVHAPLVATFLAELLRTHHADSHIADFSFRALRPLFDGSSCIVRGRPQRNGDVRLWADGPDGTCAFQAIASPSGTAAAAPPDAR